MDKFFFTPAEITYNYIDIGRKKAALPVSRMILLGILGGAYIALAAQGSNTMIHAIGNVGIAKALAGTLFTAGLMMVVVTGAELFTGNMLMVVSCLEDRSGWARMFKNWFFVYIGNFIGSIVIVLLILFSGQFDFSGGLLGGFTIKIAAYKTSLPFLHAFCMGILCNWLVCMAVWMASAAKDITGKLLAIFFPIWLFIASGFEHSVANMYYIPAGMLAKSHPAWLHSAMGLGVTQELLDGLSGSAFLLKNLVPVTLGNMIGGVLFVGVIYWFTFLFDKKSSTPR